MRWQMRKKTNHIILLLCAVFLSICFSEKVWATEKIDTTRTGSIGVSMSVGDEAITGGSLTIYKVADISDAEMKYHFTYTKAWEACTEQLKDLQNSALAESLYQYAQSVSLHGVTKEIKEEYLIFDNLEVGLYLVAQEEAAEGYCKIRPFLISVPIQNGETWNYEVDASPKVSPESGSDSPEDSEEPDKPSDEKIPQTGQLNWPIPFMVIAGLMLFGIGWSLCFAGKGRRDEK